MLIVALSAFLSVGTVTPTSALAAAAGALQSIASADDEKENALFHKNQHALELWLEQSKLPRDWALASQLLEHIGDKSQATTRKVAGLLGKAANAAPNDLLVQWLSTSSSAEQRSCELSPACPDRARELTRLDPENGAVWATVATAAWKQKDIPAFDNAIARMANAKRYDDTFSSTFRAWEDVIRRYPPAKGLRPAKNRIDISIMGVPLASAQWTDSESANDIDRSPAGAAFVLVSEISPIPMHSLLANACDRIKNPGASEHRFEDCGKAGRAMLAHSDFIIEREMGARVLRVSETATSNDIAMWRAERWLLNKFPPVGLEKDLLAFRGFLDSYDATNNEIAAIRTALAHADIPLSPPANWQPTNGKGEPVGPLNGPLTSEKYP